MPQKKRRRKPSSQHRRSGNPAHRIKPTSTAQPRPDVLEDLGLDVFGLDDLNLDDLNLDDLNLGDLDLGNPYLDDTDDLELDEEEAIEQLDIAYRSDHPMELLLLASSLLNVVDPRHDNPLGPEPEESAAPTPADIVGGLIDAGTPQTLSLGWVIAQLTDDDLLRARTVREVDRHGFARPPWLDSIAEAEVVGSLQTGEVLRDGTDIVIHARVGGHDLTAVCLVDFNMNWILKDGFFLDGGLDDFREAWRQAAGDEDTVTEPVALTDARARVENAIDIGARTLPPVQSDTWPSVRPMLEWLLRKMPPGGADFERPKWSEPARAQLAEEFIESPHGRRVADRHLRGITDDLIWYRTDYGFGDPLRWSPTAVEILLVDWYPRKIRADADYLRKMPEVLRAFIRFAHDRSGLPAKLTAEALGAVDERERAYRSTIGSPRRQGPAALLELAGLIPPLSRISREQMAEAVGGDEVLTLLDDDPLPDEAFDWTGIPEAVHEGVSAVLNLTDAVCGESFDVEHRTAVRRLLHDVAVAAPNAFRRGKPETAAAAACWLIGRANETVGEGEGEITVAELMDRFGLAATPATRVDTMRRAIGADRVGRSADLGSARYLTGTLRGHIVARRDAL